MPDILDRAFHLPLHRPLVSLSSLGLVPDPAYSDRGRTAWVAVAHRRADPTTKRANELMHVTLRDRGLTLEAYLRAQLARLHAEWADVVPVRLYLRAPDAKIGTWTRAWMGMPHADMNEIGIRSQLHALLEPLSTRADLAGYELRGRLSRKPDTAAHWKKPRQGWLEQVLIDR